MLRNGVMAVALLLVGWASARADQEYSQTIRPLLQRYCLTCHSTSRKIGELDLERFSDAAAVRRDLQVWSRVVRMVESGQMPPQASLQPSAAERLRILEWARGLLEAEARSRSGDPGRVVLRRLSNAQYQYTLRDLLGVDLQPAREFPIDGAAGEGFTNTGEALVMSPALLGKYLDGAKGIVPHAVFLPDGFRFSRHRTRRDWTDEILGRIRSFYGRYTEVRRREWMYGDIPLAIDYGQVPLEKYLRAAMELRQGRAAADEIAARQGLSGKYLGILWKVLNGEVGGSSFLLENLRSRWRSLSPQDSGKLVAEIERWYEPLWKFNSVGHLNRWLEPVTPLVREQRFSISLEAPEEGEAVALYLWAGNAGDGRDGDYLVWKRPRFEGKPIPVHGDKPRPSDLPPILLRDLPLVARTLEETLRKTFSGSRHYLGAAARLVGPGPLPALEALAGEEGLNPDLLRRWTGYLGIGPRRAGLDRPLSQAMENLQKTAHLNGWRTPFSEASSPPYQEAAYLVANSGDRIWQIPGTVPPRSVVVNPSRQQWVGIGWRSPEDLAVGVEARVEDSHLNCGNGVEWILKLRQPGLERVLASGSLENETRTFRPGQEFWLRRGDEISLLVGSLKQNVRCDLTRVDLTIRERAGGQRQWDLADDVIDSVLEGNPHADASGNPGVWHFYTLEESPIDPLHAIAPGSVLYRWLDCLSEPSLRHRLEAVARQAATLLDSGPPAAKDHPDAILYSRLTALDGPFLRDRDLTAAGRQAESFGSDRPSGPGPGLSTGLEGIEFGRHPGGEPLDQASFLVQAPAVLRVEVPPRIAQAYDFLAEAALDSSWGRAGSVQVHAGLEAPQEVRDLIPPVGANDAHPEANANPEPARFPVILGNDATTKRFREAFSAFRKWFPPAMCYTQIVPVDEGITISLFHREDAALGRLILEDGEKRELDRLWHELRYVSQDALAIYDSFDEWWNFGAHYRKFSRESREEPIRRRAQQFREALRSSESRHLDALLRFAERAYRRPLEVREKVDLLNLYRSLRTGGQEHDPALRSLLARVLVSPNFLYRIEQPPAGVKPRPVSSWELAGRLSYFLWSSMPDDELFRLAATGSIRDPEVLVRQAGRMLRDSRTRALAVEFAAQWLGFREFDQNQGKNERLFPTFARRRADMYEESVRFFEELFRRDGSVIDMLDADYTYLNQELADHYGIPDVSGSGWRRVQGIKRYQRGGLLGMGSMLSRQSGASRTSPVLRGNWIFETLLGNHLPKPPPNVPELPEDERHTQGLTVRQMVERHRSLPGCASCHDKIDPLGLALEGFDPIGRRRTRDLAGRPVDAGVRLQPGIEFQDLSGLRTYLLEQRREEFLQNFCRKLLGYALGRSVEVSDEELLAEVLQALESADFRFSAAVATIVRSPQFLHQRGRDAGSPQHP